jgi:hypothetical protein
MTLRSSVALRSPLEASSEQTQSPADNSSITPPTYSTIVANPFTSSPCTRYMCVTFAMPVCWLFISHLTFSDFVQKSASFHRVISDSFHHNSSCGLRSRLSQLFLQGRTSVLRWTSATFREALVSISCLDRPAHSIIDNKSCSYASHVSCPWWNLFP